MARHTAKSHKIRKVEILVIQIRIFEMEYILIIKSTTNLKEERTINNILKMLVFVEENRVFLLVEKTIGFFDEI